MSCLLYAFHEVEGGEVALKGIGVRSSVGGNSGGTEEERSWIDQLQLSPHFLVAGANVDTENSGASPLFLGSL
jgi:hypothetical protein